jgi:hypothetical protein
MSGAFLGALVEYCGHNACFVADIYEIEGVNVVRANGRVNSDSLIYDRSVKEKATHRLVDFPVAGFWRPDLGVFVVPSSQVVWLRANAAL